MFCATQHVKEANYRAWLFAFRLDELSDARRGLSHRNRKLKRGVQRLHKVVLARS